MPFGSGRYLHNRRRVAGISEPVRLPETASTPAMVRGSSENIDAHTVVACPGLRAGDAWREGRGEETAEAPAYNSCEQ
ncbi:unnamed protein product [Soboliphyme baturini]|uniref:Uncharacterized protein n=1 Tax=Soboliphyme baturini TaxID=241478 RepID=A0A183IH54_9BILA|nr:unnamed protein product [Soboliphyme baturini]